MFATARENFDAEFIFQQAYLFADARLRGKQALCGGRYIEVVMSDLPDVAQLLQFQIITPNSDTLEKYRQLGLGASVLDIKLEFFMHFMQKFATGGSQRRVERGLW